MDYKRWNWHVDYTGRLFILNALRRARQVDEDETKPPLIRNTQWYNAVMYRRALEEHLERN